MTSSVGESSLIRQAAGRVQYRLALYGTAVLCLLASCQKSDLSDEGASGQALLEAVKLGDSRRAALMLTEGVYMEVRDERGDTPLLYAVKTGNTDIVHMMLEKGADKTARSGNGKGSLEIALDSGNKNMVRCLLKHGVSPNEVGADNNPLLLKATLFQDKATMRLLLKNGVDASATGKDGRTSLHVAAEQGWQQGIDILLKLGASADVKDDQGACPLWYVLQGLPKSDQERSSSWVTFRKLLDAGASANVRGPNKMPLFFLAVERGLYQAATELINYGAAMNAQNESGQTALMIARDRGDMAMCALLISRGADPRITQLEAIQEMDIDYLELLCSIGVAFHDLDQDSKSRPRVGLAASLVRQGEIALLQQCLAAGANPNQPGLEGQPPLHMGVAMRDAVAIDTLLAYGADPNIYFSRPASKEFLKLTKKESMRWFLGKDRRLTPLMMAANNGDLDIIKSLIDHGAKKYKYSGKYRLYPLNFASRRSDVKAMQVILGQDPEDEKYYGVLDLSEQRVRFYNSAGKVVFSSRVSTGKSGFRTPTGTFVVTDKHRHHTSSIYGSSMPYFQRLSCSAFGFHVGNCPGYPASHGCIRMPHSSAKKLFSLIPVGTRVVIKK